ncbi:hypothetical protein SAMN05421856_106133 [Chryseobacterium taichungense]|uniref:Uncharacterized protein n=1 Tax=Chryseobacterium taichungense TaxID=295069 RepID=A0A1H8AY27_9FLAO|nr:hypothetical protein [Chryseobacterium taichungense]SEM75406.1 hypothetical protein SAMN05421856_106133 [Chryseobacterium taichungense]
MKTSKNTIEYQIRKQIEEREITPSRNLWSEIENHKEKKISSKVNWFLIAACLILTFSLGIVLFFNQDNQVTEKNGNIAKVGKTEVQLPAQNEFQEKPAELIIKNNEQKIAVEKISTDHKKVLKESPAVINDELPSIQQNSAHIVSEILPAEPSKVIAQSDSTKLQVKKKRYVDPSTLLFSVEHKDVIEKTKGKSNVASIDLNEK